MPPPADEQAALAAKDDAVHDDFHGLHLFQGRQRCCACTSLLRAFGASRSESCCPNLSAKREATTAPSWRSLAEQLPAMVRPNASNANAAANSRPMHHALGADGTQARPVARTDEAQPRSRPSVYHTHDTIAAIASAAGPGARTIIRLSGPNAVEILETCFRGPSQQCLAHARFPGVHAGTLTVSTVPIIDLPADIYLWPTSRSYTRQPSAEIHTLGSPPLASAVLQTVCAAGARLARPGEFTLRAFLAGRIDLTQAEAVLSVIDARGAEPLRTALTQLAGGLARPLYQLREDLLNLASRLEAGLDFVEDDIEFITAEDVRRNLAAARSVLADCKVKVHQRGRQDSPIRAVLVGWPNVGKSSLYNALLGHQHALVSSQPGTTRDYLTAALDLDGVQCQLFDTAGVDLDAVEKAIGGIARQLNATQAGNCEIQLFCVDGSRPLGEWERHQLAAWHGIGRFVVLTKTDIPHRAELPGPVVRTSAVTGRGLSELRRVLRSTVLDVEQGEAAAGATWDRSADSLRAADEALQRAADLIQSGGNEELVAVELRVALDELGPLSVRSVLTTYWIASSAGFASASNNGSP